MPWKETCPMHQRLQFIAAIDESDESFSEICRRFGISRKTGYKWLSRYEQLGPRGLEERAPIARSYPHRVLEPIEDLVVALRKEQPTWGPKKNGQRPPSALSAAMRPVDVSLRVVDAPFHQSLVRVPSDCVPLFVDNVSEPPERGPEQAASVTQALGQICHLGSRSLTTQENRAWPRGCHTRTRGDQTWTRRGQTWTLRDQTRTRRGETWTRRGETWTRGGEKRHRSNHTRTHRGIDSPPRGATRSRGMNAIAPLP